MPIASAASYSIYSPGGLAEAGASSPEELDAALSMERHVVMKAAMDSPVSPTRGNARVLACAVLEQILDPGMQERLDFVSGEGAESGPVDDPAAGPRYRVALPPGLPDPDMPLDPGRAVAAMYAAALDGYAALAWLSGAIPSPADPYEREAKAVRYLIGTEKASADAHRISRLGLPVKDFGQAVLDAGNARIEAGAVPFMNKARETLDAFLADLDKAAAMALSSMPASDIPVDVASGPFPARGGPVLDRDLPALAARLAPAAFPAADKVVNAAFAAPRAMRDGAGRLIIISGFSASGKPAGPGDLHAAMILPFEIAERELLRQALSSGTVPEGDHVWPEERAWLDQAAAGAPAQAVAAGVHFFSSIKLLGAILADPELQAKGLQEIAAMGILERFKAMAADGAIVSAADPSDMEAWTAACSEAMDAEAPAADAPDRDAFLAKWIRPATKISVPKEGRLADGTPFRTATAALFPDAPAIRYADLPDLAARLAAEAVQNSFARPAIGRIGILRGRGLSGAAVDPRTGLMTVSIPIGPPDADGSPKDPSTEADMAFEKASDAAVLQVAISAWEAVRRAEQVAISSGAASPRIMTPELPSLLDRPDSDRSRSKLALDARLAAIRRAGAFFGTHREFLDVYGFDFDTCAAALANLAMHSGAMPGDGTRALDAAGAFRKLERLYMSA